MSVDEVINKEIREGSCRNFRRETRARRMLVQIEELESGTGVYIIMNEKYAIALGNIRSL